MTTFDFSDAPNIRRESRRREDFASACLGADLEWSEEWLSEDCVGDGFEHHPLLAGSEGSDTSRSVTMSGLIENGRGVHSQATFARWR